MKINPILIIAIIMTHSACQPNSEKKQETTTEESEKAISGYGEGTFGSDLFFLKETHPEMVILKGTNDSAQVAIIPEYQGRVMTSTAEGLAGKSFGWINRNLIESGEIQEHFNAYGGEDRFWLGPEGGQYSIFFAEGVDFSFENWNTPAPFDTESFETVSTSQNKAVFTKDFNIKNYSGTAFNVRVGRTISLLSAQQMESMLGISLSNGVNSVAFSSENTLYNMGKENWTKEKGLLSIWILGMFQPSPGTTIVIPFKENIAESNVPVLNDAYFGKVPGDRITIADSVIFFKGDGTYRSKIGVPPQRAKPFLGSYDASNQVLTLVHCTLPENNTDYVNSMWEIQDKPFGGDAINSYNDGPLEEGGQLGPFYELETSSPAAALGPNQSITHVQTTFHFTGDKQALDAIAKKVLGVGIQEINNKFLPK